MSLLQALTQAGALRTLDHAFAQSLRRLDPATPDPVLAAAALASLAVSHGHAAFDPAQPALLVEGDIDWPAPEAWRAALAGSPWVARPDADGTAAAVPVLRRKFETREQTIVLPGGPTIPILALLLCLGFLASATAQNLMAGLIGLTVGVVIYFFRRR